MALPRPCPPLPPEDGLLGSLCVCVWMYVSAVYLHLYPSPSHLTHYLTHSHTREHTHTQPPKVQQKTKEQKLAAAMAGGKSKKKVSNECICEFV